MERAIEAGDAETGVTIMRPTAELDAGPIYLQRAEPISPEDDYGSLAPRSLRSAGCCWWRPSIRGRSPCRRAAREVTYADKIEASDRRLDPALPAEQLARRVRALTPHIGAWLELRAERAWGWTRRGRPGQRGSRRAGDRGRAPAIRDVLRGLELSRCTRRASDPWRRAHTCAGTPRHSTAAAAECVQWLKRSGSTSDPGPRLGRAVAARHEPRRPLSLRELPAPLRAALRTPNCGNSTIARMSDTANVICRSAESMLQPI